jgi:demethylmenaquinone methyltransferase/2-methoxy-6-polyprenyl-1,4-benzoquinol methylase/phosphoethanolamine N-methyltransferase
MHHHQTQAAAPETRGATIHWARLYDKLALWRILTLGRGVKIWQEMLDKAILKPGDSVLDVGCGPGSLILKAKERVGEPGRASGIDASPEMIAVAREKAQRAGIDVEFRLEVVERLPFPDASFDAVLSSLMMHHLPDEVKRQALAEIYRVLKPAGRLVIVDFKRPESRLSRMLLPAMLHRSMPVGIQDLVRFLDEAGFEGIELSDTQIKMFGYLRGVARK